MSKIGLDVSEFQSAIDWPSAKQQGVSFVIVRAGFGNNISQKDKMFQSHVEGALASGLSVGAYWFGYAYTVDGAKKKLRYVLRCWSLTRTKSLCLCFMIGNTTA